MSRMVRVGLRQWVDGIGRGGASEGNDGQREDDRQRDEPQRDLQPGGGVGVGGVCGFRGSLRGRVRREREGGLDGLHEHRIGVG